MKWFTVVLNQPHKFSAVLPQHAPVRHCNCLWRPKLPGIKGPTDLLLSISLPKVVFSRTPWYFTDSFGSDLPWFYLLHMFICLQMAVTGIFHTLGKPEGNSSAILESAQLVPDPASAFLSLNYRLYLLLCLSHAQASQGLTRHLVLINLPTVSHCIWGSLCINVLHMFQVHIYLLSWWRHGGGVATCWSPTGLAKDHFLPCTTSPQLARKHQELGNLLSLASKGAQPPPSLTEQGGSLPVILLLL